MQVSKNLAAYLVSQGVKPYFLGGLGGGIATGISAIRSGLAGRLVGGLRNTFGATNNFQGVAPEITQQNFLPQIQALQSRGNEVFAQQQNLAKALMEQSQGAGANPAIAMLNQQTGQNVAQQAALMASQRGASMNPALLARQAAVQGAGVQQNAVGQAAVLRAQQQLEAQRQLQAQQDAMARAGMTEATMLQQAQAAQNDALVRSGLGAQGLTAAAATQNTQIGAGLLGGLLSGAGSAMVPAGKAYGGEIGEEEEETSFGGLPKLSLPSIGDSYGLSKGMNSFGKGLGSALQRRQQQQLNIQAMQGGSGGQYMTMGLANGGQVKFSTHLLNGGRVPGAAPFPGDNLKNDVHPALLSPGEIVIPRSIAQSKDAPAKAATFVKHLQANSKPKGGYEKVAEARMSLKERVENIEQMLACGGRVS